jgi:hypothetical protein
VYLLDVVLQILDFDRKRAGFFRFLERSQDDLRVFLRERDEIGVARSGDRAETREFTEIIDAGKVLLHAAAETLLVRRIEVGDDVAIAQMRRKLVVVVARSA